MKRFTLVGLILVLLAFSVAPVLAAGRGKDKGVSAGQENGLRIQNQAQLKSNNGKGNSSEGETNDQGNRSRTPFYLQGTVASVDAGAKTLTINVDKGNVQVKQSIGGTITLTIPDGTVIVKLTQGNDEDEQEAVAPETSSGEDDQSEAVSPEDKSSEKDKHEGAAPVTVSDENETPGNKVAVELGQLVTGDIVAIHGDVSGDIFTARMITVYMTSTTSQPVVVTP